MVKVRYGERVIEVAKDATVLQALLRGGAYVPYQCQVGACHTCRMRYTKGAVPALSQIGLTQEEIVGNYFLACLCVPTTDLEVQRGDVS